MPANREKVDDNNFNKKTALVKHVITKDHRVDWNHSKILTFETDFTKHQFLESFFIHNSENAINDEENCFILKFLIIWRNLQLVIIRFQTFCFAFFFQLNSTVLILPHSCFRLLLVLMKNSCIAVRNVDEY